MRCALSMTTLALLAIPLEAQDQPTRPPITGIAHVRIYCTDLHKSLDFYSKILGLPPRSGGCTGVSRPCFIINDHQQIGLSQAPSAAPTSLLVDQPVPLPGILTASSISHFATRKAIPSPSCSILGCSSSPRTRSKPAPA
ncbi:MAG: hypothetical protein DMG38_01110 [Acidobacteria bacterium]|nr:MAG: hypothetical protein DMG38_01110 [Acidobacteriota bacterium]